MNELIKIDYENDRPTVLARDLHKFLEVGTPYDKWFPRMCEYGFAVGEDYSTFLSNRSDGLPGKPRQDAQLTIDMAKEICMLQRNEKGKQARQYFLQLEKEWNSPEAVMARALRLSESRLKSAEAKIHGLQGELDTALPKAEFYDTFVSSDKCTGLRVTAKELGVPEREFVRFLIGEKYLYRTPSKQLLPYAKKSNEGLFEVKDYYTKSDIVKPQIFFTPQGKKFFYDELIKKGLINRSLTA